MATRTTRLTVTFRRPFVLASFDRELPAGSYDIETDEERLDGISFPVYRRTLTVIRLHPSPDHPGATRTLSVDPNELDAALQRDRAPARTAGRSEADGGAPTRAAEHGPAGGGR